MKIHPVKLVLRCYADKEGDQWQAFCLDLSLAAQGDSFESAKRSLEGIIADYVREALCEDREHAAELLNRKAPLNQWAKFYWYKFLWKTGNFHKEMHRLFKEQLPLTVPHQHA